MSKSCGLIKSVTPVEGLFDINVRCNGSYPVELKYSISKTALTSVNFSLNSEKK